MKMTIPRVALLLAVVCAGVMSEGSETAREAGSLPRSLSTDEKWDAVQGERSTLGAVQSLIQEDSGGKNVVACPDGVYRSAWSAIDRRLQQDAKAVEALRLLEDSEAALSLAAARRSSDRDRVLATCRRYPWAAASHAALLDYGDEMLRSGQAGLALRCFQDVLLRGTDPATRARAQAGLWLAAAQFARSSGELAATFRQIDPPTRYPWMGGEASARTIQERLAAGIKAADAPPALAALKTRRIELPASPPWIVQFSRGDESSANARAGLLPRSLPLVGGPDGVLLAGPNLLAWYAGDDLVKPRWSHTASAGVSSRLWSVVAVAPLRPVVAHGLVFARWGIEEGVSENEDGNRHSNRLNGIAAFDAASGDMLWSTASDQNWQELCPINDPTHADGRLYLLAVQKGRSSPMMCLVALDARSGEMLWRRDLVAGRRTLFVNEEVSRQRRRGRKMPDPDEKSLLGRYGSLDVVEFANPVTVAGGTVYCSTNMGFVARCDARDGLIEWIAGYPRNPEAIDPSVLLRRAGAAPLLAGGHVVFTPRDTSGIIAVDCQTGKIAWQELGSALDDSTAGLVRGKDRGRPAVDETDPSVEALGLAGDCVIAFSDRHLLGLEAATGRLKWQRDLEARPEVPAAIADKWIFLEAAAKFLRIDTTTGEIVESRPRDSSSIRGIVLPGAELFAVDAADGRIASEQVLRREDGDWSLPQPRRPNNPAIFVYRTGTPPEIDGDPSDWEPESTTTWTNGAGEEGKSLFAYDNTYLYLGMSGPAPNAAPREGYGSNGDGWLELQVHCGRFTHCAIALDHRGRSAWESIGRWPLPSGARAAVSHRLAEGRITYELAIPLVDLWGEDYAAWDYWRGLAVKMLLHGGEVRAGQAEAASEIGGSVQNLYLYSATRNAHTILNSLAREMPDLDESWQYAYEMWRVRSPEDAKASEFYRQYIAEHPGAPELKTAQSRLKRAIAFETNSQLSPSFAPVDPVPYSPSRILAAVEEQVPRVAFGEYARRLWTRADGLLRSQPERRATLRRAVLAKASPEDTTAWLGAFFRASSPEEDCVPALEKLIADCRLPEGVLEKFRHHMVHAFIRNWQVIGVFPNPGSTSRDVVYPVEREEIALDHKYDGLKGKIRWQLYRGDDDYVNLDRFFDHFETGVAYALCWVHADDRTTVRFELGSNDGVKFWLNRKQVHDSGAVHRPAKPGEDSFEAQLQPGWNEVLLKIDNANWEWGFYCEIRDPVANEAVRNLKIRTEPPPRSDAEPAGQPPPTADRPTAPESVEQE